MNDDDLTRLLKAEIVAAAAGSDAYDKFQHALISNQRSRTLRRTLLVVAIVVVTLTALSLGYLLAASVLPPLDTGGWTAVLWAPVAAAALLGAATAWLALSAVAES